MARRREATEPKQSTPGSEKARIERLVEVGEVSHESDEPLTPFDPIHIRGAPVSETILEEREDRF